MIYREHFIDRQYLQHGVDLPAGGAVLDVGAHVGLFSMFAAEAVGPSGAVVAVEPAPATHACCAANSAAHAAWSGGAAAGIQVVDAACGDGSAPRATLTVYDRQAGRPGRGAGPGPRIRRQGPFGAGCAAPAKRAARCPRQAPIGGPRSLRGPLDPARAPPATRRATLMNTVAPGRRQEEMLGAFVRAQLEEGRPAGTLAERLLVRRRPPALPPRLGRFPGPRPASAAGRVCPAVPGSACPKQTAGRRPTRSLRPD